MKNEDLKGFVQEYLAENEAFVKENEVQISLEGEKGNYIKMDKGASKRVSDNLFTNSIRYREKKTGRIEIAIRKMSDKVFWSVKDDGTGVAESDLEKMIGKGRLSALTSPFPSYCKFLSLLSPAPVSPFEHS